VTIRRSLLALALLLLPALASAQQAAPPPPPPQQEGSGEFSLVDTSGNASTQSIGIGGEYFARPDDWVFHAKGAYVRNKSDDILTAQSLSLLFRGAKTLSTRLSAFGEYDFLRDRFAGIDARHQVLGGLSYKVVDTEPQTLAVDAGIGYANEQRLLQDTLSTAIWTGALAYRVRISPSAEFTDGAGFNESLSEGRDWRVENVAALSARITTVFSLKVSNTIRYVHQPVFGFKTTDTITAVALVAKLRSRQ
jgi:putative salt-induced outer membrane protein